MCKYTVSETFGGGKQKFSHAILMEGLEYLPPCFATWMGKWLSLDIQAGMQPGLSRIVGQLSGECPHGGPPMTGIS